MIGHLFLNINLFHIGSQLNTEIQYSHMRAQLNLGIQSSERLGQFNLQVFEKGDRMNPAIRFSNETLIEPRNQIS